MLRRIVNLLGNQLSIRNAIALQLVSYDLPGLIMIVSQQPLEEALAWMLHE